MQLRFQEFPSFFAFYKPYGLRTHSVAEGQLGFVETLSEKLNEKLFVVHRLDKETSGLILFARTKAAAQMFSKLFENRGINKTYLFLTDRKIDRLSFLARSRIEKKGSQYVSVTATAVDQFNAETEFQLIEQFPGTDFSLWKAKPKTGKPHQIRLHAEDSGIPILGDQEHNGSSFFRLALFAQKIEFNFNNKNFKIELEPSPLFQNPAQDNLALLLEENWFLRHQIYKIESFESFRLIHHESHRFHVDFRVDVYADHLWVYDYTESGLSEKELKTFDSFAQKHKLKLIVRHMLDRGSGLGRKEQSTLLADDPMDWIAQENGVRYLLKTNSGFSPGLFLDQRENRSWVKNNSDKKDVLNLFSYTAGFSVNAALGCANVVTTVDVSRNFLEWSKENFQLNGLSTENHEFFLQDSLLFLKGALKRKRTWNLIICDPPSFGRSRDGVWRIEKDLPDLAHLLVSCLSKDGQIIFTCNYEGWNLDKLQFEFIKKIEKGSVQLKPLPCLGFDFELTDSESNLMKGFIVNPTIIK